MAWRCLPTALPRGCALFVLVLVFAPISGAHFQPIGQPDRAARRGYVNATTLLAFAVTQVIASFAERRVGARDVRSPLWAPSLKQRTGLGQWLPKGVATFGLVLAIMGSRRYGAVAVAARGGYHICAAYWFTASTSFANPVVTSRGRSPRPSRNCTEPRCWVRGRSCCRGMSRVSQSPGLFGLTRSPCPS